MSLKYLVTSDIPGPFKNLGHVKRSQEPTLNRPKMGPLKLQKQNMMIDCVPSNMFKFMSL